jgi:hypothetical protein
VDGAAARARVGRLAANGRKRAGPLGGVRVLEFAGIGPNGTVRADLRAEAVRPTGQAGRRARATRRRRGVLVAVGPENERRRRLTALLARVSNRAGVAGRATFSAGRELWRRGARGRRAGQPRPVLAEAPVPRRPRRSPPRRLRMFQLNARRAGRC